MSFKIRQFAAIALVLVLCAGAVSATSSATDPYKGKKLRIGLAWQGSSVGTLADAKLLNADVSAVTGYRMGYYDEALDFVEVARTEHNYLSMVKTTNLYRSGENYTTAKPSGSYETLGCYHLKHSGQFDSYESALRTAQTLEGGFVAWINGVYQVRTGSYTTAADAQAAADAANAAELERWQKEQAAQPEQTESPEDEAQNQEAPSVSETPAADAGTQPEAEDPESAKETELLPDRTDTPQVPAEPITWSVCYTTSYGINVVKTGTCDILLQFDGGQTTPLGVMPGYETNEGAVTWFKGYKYLGGFRYERINGGNITVVSIVDVDTYVKGVVPYESNKLWPLETLKAQAMCARNYGLINLNKHKEHGFDLCNTVDCQVYYGMGSGKESFQPSALSNQAVEETSGMYVWYRDKLAQTYFAASSGGGTEDVSNVWGSKQSLYPYLTGVVDPYETSVADKIPNYEYSKTFTKSQLTSILQSKGYATNTAVETFEVTKFSKTGNVLEMKFTYTNGKSNTFASVGSSWLRSKLGCRTMHFTVTPVGEGVAKDVEFAVNGAQNPTLTGITGMYALAADGSVVPVQSYPYVITGTGTIASTQPAPAVTGGEVKYLVKGAGNGHGIGYSQWGGYGMGVQGFTYDEILKFYFTGVTIGSTPE